MGAHCASIESECDGEEEIEMVNKKEMDRGRSVKSIIAQANVCEQIIMNVTEHHKLSVYILFLVLFLWSYMKSNAHFTLTFVITALHNIPHIRTMTVITRCSKRSLFLCRPNNI